MIDKIPVHTAIWAKVSPRNLPSIKDAQHKNELNSWIMAKVVKQIQL